jgi:diguanylate cyclase (GGDEF)-like protein/PAS domain S-box-containing protein
MNVPLLKQLAVWLGLVALSAVLFVKTQIHDMESYNQQVNVLSELQATDASLNQDVIRARYRLLVNYDPLVQETDKLHALLQQLRKGNYPVQGHESSAAGARVTLDRLADAIESKSTLVEYFKSDNAVLKNSLSYYPYALQRMLGAEAKVGVRTPHAPAGLVRLGPDLLSGVLQYIQSGDPEQRSATETRLESLRRYASIPALRSNVDIAVRHTEIILEYADRVETLVEQILAFPSGPLADELYRAYTAEHEQVLHDTNVYRVLLYLFSILLLAYTAFIIYRLRDSARALFQEKERAQVTLHSIGDGVITTDVRGNVEYMNPAAEHITGWRTEELRGQPLDSTLRVVDENPLFERKDGYDPATPPKEGFAEKKLQASLMRRDGLRIAIDESVSPIRDQNGTVVGEIRVFHDVSEARSLASKLSWQVSHDLLTGLINRHEFERRVEQALASARERELNHAVLYLDLDQFKIVNDTCGHAAGDELLRQFGARLVSKVRDHDTVARLGGDEFGILLEGCQVEQARHIADGLLQAIKEFRFAWEGRPFDVGASIGLATLGPGNANLAEILSAADMACYAAKELGRNRVHVYEENDTILVRRYAEMQWVSRITSALQENRFQLYWQMILPLAASADHARHYELLLRMTDEHGNIVPPGAFLSAAERYNLITTLDRWVVRNAFAHLAETRRRREPWPGMCAINLSGTTLNDEQFLAFVHEQLSHYEIPPHVICFEVTESAAIANLAQATDFISGLKERGCRFALDDFGSGLSSFVYLKQLPVDYLKIYGGFIENLTNDTIDRAMVAAINDVAHIMGIKTIAEWVKNSTTLQQLRAMGLDYAQGCGIDEPRPLHDEMTKRRAGNAG